ncbi:MAG: tributyrin esterase [Planctomycetota bacterium]
MSKPRSKPSAQSSDSATSRATDADTVYSSDSTSQDALNSINATVDLSQIDPSTVASVFREYERKHEDDEPTTVQVTGFPSLDHLLMRTTADVRLLINQSIGDFAFAYSRTTEFRVHGDAGNALAEALAGGAVRIRGNAGDAVGVSMQSGTVAVYGNAKDRCGALMAGGELFVRGNVGDACGLGMVGGTMVIGGNAGKDLGAGMVSGTIFVRGDVESLGSDVVESPVRSRDQLRLGLLLVNASIRGDASDFRRITHCSILEKEKATRGEINPKWR